MGGERPRPSPSLSASSESFSIHFETVPLSFGHGGEGAQVEYGKVLPTSYRGKLCGSFLTERDKWKANGIANLYWVRPRLKYHSESRPPTYSLPLCNIYRHSVVGYSPAPLDHLYHHTRAWMKHAIDVQRKMRRPLRFVTHNLVNHLTSSFDGEWTMMQRQAQIFGSVFHSLIKEEREKKEKKEGDYEEEEFAASFGSFALPLNSDQTILSIPDYDRSSNKNGVVTYLEWILQDVLQVFIFKFCLFLL